MTISQFYICQFCAGFRAPDSRFFLDFGLQIPFSFPVFSVQAQISVPVSDFRFQMVAAASAKSPTLACFASVGFEFIEQSLKYVTT